MKSKLIALAEFAKYRISIAVTFTVAIGYLIAGEFEPVSFMRALMGVFLLSSAASGLNQLQEIKYDRLMPRTQDRPLVTGEINKTEALIFILVLSIGGGFLLYLNNYTAFFLGLANMFWYNAVYTPLKRKTTFAVIVGSLIGAIPVMIGYSSANGYIFDKGVLLVTLFMLIWQIPHFMLLWIKFGEQYKIAGYATLHDKFSTTAIRTVILIWVLLTSLITFTFPLFGIIHSIPFLILLIVLNVWVINEFIKLALNDKEIEFKFRPVFMKINLYMLCVMLLVLVDFIFYK